MERRRFHWLRRIAAVPVLLYAALVVGWGLANGLFGDRFWLLGLANAFAVYLFVPLPLMAPLALLARRRVAWIALLIVTLLFVELFGSELIPPPPVTHAGADAPALTAMTYNVLYTTTGAESIADNILRANPDLIAFQELSYLRAKALEQMIGESYPYRTSFHLDACYAEVAIWSRYPILRTEDVDPDVLCRLRSVVIDFAGHPVRVVNVHAWSYTGIDRESVERSFRWRHEQLDLVLGTLEEKPEPVVLLGDLNSTPMSDVYRTLSAHFVDAFREAGWGLGHTFPTQGGRCWGIPYPSRMVRIDHVFHSAHWTAEAAWVEEWDGISDHLPVVARLRLPAPGGR